MDKINGERGEGGGREEDRPGARARPALHNLSCRDTRDSPVTVRSSRQFRASARLPMRKLGSRRRDEARELFGKCNVLVLRT